MGTNYYFHEKPPCECCKRPYEPRHIGKSSAGWVFSLHVYPEDGITDIDDWERLWAAGGMIVDEYGRDVSLEEMRITIMARARPERWDEKPFMYESWDEFHRQNNSERGPAGLVRAKLSAYCIKHGNGTWDCHIGDFS